MKMPDKSKIDKIIMDKLTTAKSSNIFTIKDLFKTLEKKNSVQIHIYNIIGEMIEKIEEYVDTHQKYTIKKIMENLEKNIIQPYMKYFSEQDHKEDQSLSIINLYTGIYKYLKIIKNNRELYKEYEKNPQEFKRRIFAYKILPEKATEEIGIKLINGFIVAIIPDNIMDLYYGIEIGGLRREKGERLDGYVNILEIRLSDYEKDLTYSLFSDSDSDYGIDSHCGVIKHELQHAYNKIYMKNEEGYKGIESTIYDEAKNEIIAQRTDTETKNAEKIFNIMSTQNCYNYINIHKETHLQYLNKRINDKKKIIKGLKNVGVSDFIINNAIKSLNEHIQLREIITQEDKLQKVKEKYLKNLRKYIYEAGEFIQKSNNIIKNPYIILARTPMDKWSNLLEVVNNK